MTKEQNILVIDTSLQGVTLGLVRRNGAAVELLRHYGSSQPQEAAAKLPALASDLLHSAGLGFTNVDHLLVSHGPGSFTGIKIGLSFASGFKKAGTATKVYSVSSFKALTRYLPHETCIALPATQTAGYFAIKTELGVQVGVIDIALAQVFQLYDEGQEKLVPFDANLLENITLLGPWPKIQTWLESRTIGVKHLELKDLHEAVVLGMTQDFIANSGELSEGRLEPIYLRKSAPEEKLDQQGKDAT